MNGEISCSCFPDVQQRGTGTEPSVVAQKVLCVGELGDGSLGACLEEA